MPLVGFEYTIPVFERAKTVRAPDRTATVIGSTSMWLLLVACVSVVRSGTVLQAGRLQVRVLMRWICFQFT
jgi:hypothetical protein